jgi:hypothetical protein
VGKMGEFELTKQICEFLNKVGMFYWRDKQGAQNPGRRGFPSSNGVADIIGCFPDGRLFAIEVKCKGNKQNESQKKFQIKVSENNGFYLLAYSLDDVINAVKDRRHYEPTKEDT